MPVLRSEVAKYKDDLTRFYACLTKVPYVSRYTATRSAYHLEIIRNKRYDVYFCEYCGFFHVGRYHKYSVENITKREEWIWNIDRSGLV